MCRRTTVLLALSLLAVVTTKAMGAPWREGPVRPEPNGGVVTCLRAPAPGLASALGPLGRTTSAVDLLGFESPLRGFSQQQRLTLGNLPDCASVASNGRGTTLVAGFVLEGATVRLRATLVEAGATKSFALTSLPSEASSSVAVVVSPRGDAIVSWAELTVIRNRKSRARFPDFGLPRRQARILVARRLPGGDFGSPEVVLPSHKLPAIGDVKLAAAADGSGHFTLAWARGIGTKFPIPRFASVETTSAEPGRPFAAVQTVAPQSEEVSTPVLVVASDGRALLAYAGRGAEAYGELSIAERVPGADRFGAPTRFLADDLSYSDPTVALREDGAAVVAWRTNNEGGRGGVIASVRVRAGPFPTPVTIKRAPRIDGAISEFLLTFTRGHRPEPPLDEENRRLQALLSTDGRVVLTWIEPKHGRDGDLLARPHVALASLVDPAHFVVEVLGSPCRSANGMIPLADADGLPAVAWTDNVTEASLGEEFPAGGGRLHAAVPAQAQIPGGHAPRISLRARAQRLQFDQPLRLSVRCREACDVRAFLRGRRYLREGGHKFPTPDAAPRALGSRRLASSGRAWINLTPSFRTHIAPRGGGPVRVAVHVCDPKSGAMARRFVRVKVARRPVPSLTVPVNIRARRVGSRIVVRWRTERPAFRMTFTLEGRRTQKGRVADPTLYGYGAIEGRGRRVFRAVLSPRRPARVHFVEVQAVADDPPEHSRKLIVPVTR